MARKSKEAIERHRAWEKENYKRKRETKLIYQAEWTKANPEYYASWRYERWEWMRILKRERGCDICGYASNASALHWHHRQKDGKDDSVSAMMAKNRSVEDIEKELQKCDLLCANCHAEVHWPEPV